MVLYFITGNKNKLKEMKSFIPYIKQLELNLPEIQSNLSEEVIKAKLNEANFMHPNLEFIVEDTSLKLDCLGGFPGPYIKSFLEKNSLKDIYNIAKNMNNYNAQAITVIGYKDRLQNKHYFEGIVKGTIIKPKVKTNFGWDPIFKPLGYKISFGQMKREEKNKISMRKIAAKKFKEYYDSKK